jgi:hypothetical protein
MPYGRRLAEIENSKWPPGGFFQHIFITIMKELGTQDSFEI